MVIDNPMLGQADLSLVPGGLMTNAKLVVGGANTVANSDHFGGILSVSSESNTKGFTSGMSVGSFKNFQNWASGNWEIKKVSGRINLWHQYAKNDFPVEGSHFRERQQHSQRRYYGTEGQVLVKLNQNSNLKAAFWVQESDRQLGPSLWEPQSLATQKDANRRFHVSFKKERKSSDFEGGLGLMEEILHYQDPGTHVNSKSRISSLVPHFHWKTETKNWTWSLETQGLLSRTEANLSDPGPRLGTMALLAKTSYRFQDCPLQLDLNLRNEIRQLNALPLEGNAFLPSLDLTYSNKVWGNFHWAYQQKQRFPTLNDLYWPGSGNLKLKMENGHAFEIGWNQKFHLKNQVQWNTQIKGYTLSIFNFIQWLPEGAIWKPGNLGHVRSTGLELETNVQVPFQKGIWGLSLESGYCRSIQTKPRFHGDASIGQQRPFIPEWQHAATFFLNLTSWEYRLWFQSIGLRPTGTGANMELPGYHLWSARLAWKPKSGKKYGFQTFCEARNLLDKTFQSVPGYPMPGRQWALGLEFRML